MIKWLKVEQGKLHLLVLKYLGLILIKEGNKIKWM